MPFTYRKSTNFGGGARVNINKKSVGLSVGGKGARFSASTSGRRTTTVSAPGTGARWSHATGGTRTRQSGRRASGTAGSGHAITSGSPAPSGSLRGRAPILFAMLVALMKMATGLVLIALGALMTALAHVRKFYSGPDQGVRARRQLVTARSLIVFCLLGSVVMLIQTLYAGAVGYLVFAVGAALWMQRLRREQTRRLHEGLAARADAEHQVWLRGDDD
jgi:hypothetical protein